VTKRFSRAAAASPDVSADADGPVLTFAAETEVFAEPPPDPPVSGDFLQNLTAPAFQAKQQHDREVEELRAVTAKAQKEQEKVSKRMVATAERARAKTARSPATTASSAARAAVSHLVDDDLFSNEGTPLLGRERIILLTKVQQYKTLFPQKVGKMKVKKNCTVEELQQLLDEMDCLINVTTLDDFITESIIGCIKIVEGATANLENYNLTGLSDMLKQNPQFTTLCKMLCIKYGCFNAVPPEFQLIMVVATSAYICTTKNKSRRAMSAYLDQPIHA